MDPNICSGRAKALKPRQSGVGVVQPAGAAARWQPAAQRQAHPRTRTGTAGASAPCGGSSPTCQCASFWGRRPARSRVLGFKVLDSIQLSALKGSGHGGASAVPICALPSPHTATPGVSRLKLAQAHCCACCTQRSWGVTPTAAAACASGCCHLGHSLTWVAPALHLAAPTAAGRTAVAT